MHRIFRIALQYRLPILSGLLIGTSYIPFYPWALFFCVTPLFLFWWRRAQSVRQALFAGWLTQFILNLIGFHWIAYTAIEFGHFPVIGGILSLIGFAAIAHLYYPAAGGIAFALIRRLGLSGPWALFTYVFSFALCDRLFTKIFSWHLGYPWLWAGWPGSQFSDVIGFEGLNVISILVNALLAWAIVEGLFDRTSWKGRPIRILAGALALLGAVNLAGLGRERPWRRPDAELKIATVQGNIGNFDKYWAEYKSEFGYPIVRKYIELSRAAIAQFPAIDILMWPETAFPAALDREYHAHPLQAQVLTFVRESRIPLITGSYSQNFGSREVYNGFFVFDSSGALVQNAYRKTILLVFGETFPFSEYIPYMEKLFPDQGSFGRGSGPTVVKVPLPARTETGPTAASIAFGSQICYEGLYPWFSAQLARDGAQIFANVTNDSWFWSPFEPNQHLYMTIARVIEFRRPLIRATNTGITTAALATGEVLQKSPMNVEWSGLFKVPYHSRPEHTFYEKYGAAWPAILATCLAITLVLGSAIGLRSARGRATDRTHRT